MDAQDITFLEAEVYSLLFKEAGRVDLSSINYFLVKKNYIF